MPNFAKFFTFKFSRNPGIPQNFSLINSTESRKICRIRCYVVKKFPLWWIFQKYKFFWIEAIKRSIEHLFSCALFLKQTKAKQQFLISLLSLEWHSIKNLNLFAQWEKVNDERISWQYPFTRRYLTRTNFCAGVTSRFLKKPFRGFFLSLQDSRIFFTYFGAISIYK